MPLRLPRPAMPERSFTDIDLEGETPSSMLHDAASADKTKLEGPNCDPEAATDVRIRLGCDDQKSEAATGIARGHL